MNQPADIPIISIVTPSYNQGRFIADTIESVINQEGDFYIDYIIMDGASTDNSVEIIKKYADLVEKCPVVYTKEGVSFRSYGNCKGVSYRWWSEKDGGQVNALKKGFNCSRGMIYGWLNSDDYYIGTNVFKIVTTSFQKDQNIDLLTSDGLFVDINKNVIGKHRVKFINFYELVYLDYHILQPSTFFKRSVYEKIGIRDDMICAFDADFFIHSIYSGFKIKKLEEDFSAFRIYEDIKTLKLSYLRYKESIKISFHYSKRFYFIIISILYKYFEIVLKRKYTESSFFHKIFECFKKYSYKTITGLPDRM